MIHDDVKEHCRTPFRQEVWDRLAEGFRFVRGEFDDDAAFARLAETLEKLDAERGTGGNHAFYLAIPPKSFPVVCEQLHKSGLARPREDRWSRVVIEKPFGHDLDSARDLNNVVNSVFPEESVFRIDHYLGKETVQNILALRFANQLFDPIWNAHYVDHVQITMAEDIGLGGRAGYYDGIGAARDVIQNHLMQLLALTAMEEPVSFNPKALQAEKIKVLSATQLAEPLDETTSRGQYAAGWQGGEEGGRPARRGGLLQGLHHRDVRRHHARGRHPPLGRRAVLPADRKTIGPQGDRDRAGLQARAASAVRRHHDRRARHQRHGHPGTARRRHHAAVRLQGPGSAMEVRDVNMDFSYGSAFAEDSPEAYERLILDVLLGEPSLFPVNAEVELAWEILDPVLDYWASHGKPDPYESGTWGPAVGLRDVAPHRPGMAAAMIVDCRTPPPPRSTRSSTSCAKRPASSPWAGC